VKRSYGPRSQLMREYATLAYLSNSCSRRWRNGHRKMDQIRDVSRFYGTKDTLITVKILASNGVSAFVALKRPG
jgi:hypothetical protein